MRGWDEAVRMGLACRLLSGLAIEGLRRIGVSRLVSSEIGNDSLSVR